MLGKLYFSEIQIYPLGKFPLDHRAHHVVSPDRFFYGGEHYLFARSAFIRLDDRLLDMGERDVCRHFPDILCGVEECFLELCRSGVYGRRGAFQDYGPSSLAAYQNDLRCAFLNAVYRTLERLYVSHLFPAEFSFYIIRRVALSIQR